MKRDIRTATTIDGLKITEGRKVIRRYGRDAIAVEVEAWGLHPGETEPNLLKFKGYKSYYAIGTVYGGDKPNVFVPRKTVDDWIKTLPVVHHFRQRISPKYFDQAVALAKQVDKPIKVIRLEGDTPTRMPSTSPKEIPEYADATFLESNYSLEQVKRMARDKGVSADGSKRDIIKRLLK